MFEHLTDVQLLEYYNKYNEVVSVSDIAEAVKIKGMDCKFAYHIVRLLDEVEQIMIEGDIDLQRNREQLKSIRRGEWKEEDIIRYFEDKERTLEKVYQESKLRVKPDEEAIKQLLINCLEDHYGSLKGCVENPARGEVYMKKIMFIVEEYQSKLNEAQ